MQIDLFTLWFLLIGVLLIGMALAGTLVKRLPLTTSLLYLGIGVILGPHVSGLLRVDPVADSAIVERLAEVAVIVALFTAGLKLRASIDIVLRGSVPQDGTFAWNVLLKTLTDRKFLTDPGFSDPFQ